MLIKFDFSSKTGVLVVKFAFATANLQIETLRMRRRFARVFMKGFALRLALKQRHKRTRKWPINIPVVETLQSATRDLALCLPMILPSLRE